jgi:hypothetical protein
MILAFDADCPAAEWVESKVAVQTSGQRSNLVGRDGDCEKMR